MSEPPPVKMTKSPDYRLLSATGVIAAVKPPLGTLIFHADRIEPECTPTGKITLGSINREMQVEIHLPLATFKGAAQRMMELVNQYEEREKQQVTAVKTGQAPESMYG